MAEKNSDVTIIPASQRPDGTWRKEIRVKSGYVPPDEVERYQSIGRQVATNKPSLPPGMSAGDVAPKKTKNQKKNERKKMQKQEMVKKSKDEENRTDELARAVEKVEIKGDESPKLSKADISKKLKNLKKKLRQIEELEKRVDSGEVKQLSKEQQEKVGRKKEITDEIEDLELDLKLCDE